jgi:hypothetical protein
LYGWSWFTQADGIQCGTCNENNATWAPFPAADGSIFGHIWCPGNEIAQTMSGFVSGAVYHVKWSTAGRPGFSGGNLWVLMDAVTIAQYDVNNSDGFIQTNVAFTATATSHRLRFYHNNPWAISIFIDDIQIEEINAVPRPPINLTASQGTYSNKVEITWEVNSGDNVISSKVYRAEINNTNSATVISGTLPNTNLFDDVSALVNSNYFYWVRAMNSNGWSDFSESAIGFSTDNEGPIMPTNSLPVEGAYFPLSAFPVDLEWNRIMIRTAIR